MLCRFPLLLLLAATWAPAALALTLDMPGNAELLAEEIAPLATYALPVAPFGDGGLAVRPTEGEVTRQAWRILAGGGETLQIAAPLRAQLLDQGFAVLLDCETDICGGFDFRFATEVMAPPAMHVDLGDFRFLAAERIGEDGAAERVGVLISRTAGALHVQIIRAGPPGAGATLAEAGDAPLPAPAPATARAVLPNDLGAELEAAGRVVLSDLAFGTGSAQLGEGSFGSLAALAEYLAANPGRRIALVGHTDAEGALDANIALSKRRAGSVMERLATLHGVPRGQMTAEGMGWLAPLATNLTPEGREANRRVEAILISTE